MRGRPAMATGSALFSSRKRGIASLSYPGRWPGIGQVLHHVPTRAGELHWAEDDAVLSIMARMSTPSIASSVLGKRIQSDREYALALLPGSSS